MTINELLVKLYTKEDELKKQYEECYDKFLEVGKEIKDYYENPFRTPTEIPTELTDKASYWYDAYTEAFIQHGNIRTTIKTIENTLKES